MRQDHTTGALLHSEKARWPKTAATTAGLGQFFTDAVRTVAACSSSATPETCVPGHAVGGEEKAVTPDPTKSA